jgi:hypothetical protein
MSRVDGIGRMVALNWNYSSEKGIRVTLVVSPHAFVNSPNVPCVLPVDLQHEYPAKPRLLALSETDAALANCRRLDCARQIGRSK